jgi:carboxyl-terminal processing protease
MIIEELLMKKLMIKLSLAVVILLLAFSSYLMANNNLKLDNNAKDKEQVLIQLVMHSLSNWHYRPLKINDQFSDTAYKLYLKNLDSAKKFLYQSDVDDFARYRLRIDDQIASGSTAFLDMTTATWRKRVEEVQGLCQEILSQPFNYQTKEFLELDPEKRTYCDGKSELKELWRKLLKYQTLTVYLQLAQEKEYSAKSEKLRQKIDPRLEVKARQKVARDIKRNLNRLLQEERVDQMERYLDNITASFDPHTTYYAPQSKENFEIDMTGTLEGIGAQLHEQEDGDYIKVEKVIPGSPAWRGKQLKEGDLIMKVAEGSGEPVDIANMRMNDVLKLIRGKKGTLVRLTVKKPDGQIETIPIIRDVVVLEETYAKSAVIQNEKIGKTFGYISLPSFYRNFNDNKGRNSSTDMRHELEKLNKMKVDGIILDLRNNGGGALTDAVEVSGLFIKDGPIVQVRERNGKVEVLKDEDPGIVYQGPLVVLVNSLSASASEILSAALQDYGRAVIVGTNSFGKGTVQTLVDLDQILPKNYADVKPLGSLKLTIQKFYRVNGGSTQYKGVTADVTLPDQLSYYDIGERKLDNYLPYDTVNPVTIKPWGKKYNLDAIKARSAKRVQASKVFSLIKANINQLQRQKKQTLQALQLSKIVAEQKTLKTQTEKLNKIQTAKTYFEVWDSYRKNNKVTEEWLQQINKDSYIEEASYILNDLICQK